MRVRPNPQTPSFFNLEDLTTLFGVSERKVRSWISRDLFASVRIDVLVPRKEVQRFMRERAEEYHMARVEQGAFTALMFPERAREVRRVRKQR